MRKNMALISASWTHGTDLWRDERWQMRPDVIEKTFTTTLRDSVYRNGTLKSTCFNQDIFRPAIYAGHRTALLLANSVSRYETDSH